MNAAQEELALWTKRARDTGTEAAERYDREWIEEVVEGVRADPEGTVENAGTLRDRFGSPASPGAMGALMLKLQREGLLVHDGFMRSGRLKRHGGLQSTWRRSGVADVHHE